MTMPTIEFSSVDRLTESEPVRAKRSWEKPAMQLLAVSESEAKTFPYPFEVFASYGVS